MSERRFHPLDVNAFKLLVERFSFRRRIDAVHLHHTWRPNHAQYRGHDTILGMWRFHTQNQGWSDIAQHISIAPDGTIWTGRDWNRRPASASGFNGNDTVGPFMIEMIGDFDRGKDRFEGAQKAAALEVIAAIQARWDLPERSLKFHNALSSKTCPGDSIGYEDLIKELKQVRATAKAAAPQAGARALRPFDPKMLEIQKVLDDLSSGEGRGPLEPADAELPEPGVGAEGARLIEAFEASGEGAGERGGRVPITPRMLADLAPHMVNLNQGRFSRAGRVTTDPGDVDAIFDQHLATELGVARQEKRPLRMLFYAHGGLVSEESGISVAHKHISWWKANGVYPIYFTWETGLVETLRSFLPFGGRRALPGVEGRGITDFTDRALEKLAHLPGEKVWGGMKRAAERSVDPIPVSGGQPQPLEGGGARYVAQKLAAFLQQHAGSGVPIELHAVGHSAGAIFHSWFLPDAVQLGSGPFTSVHFLAPAITVDGFIRRLAGNLGQNALRHLTVYTMKKALELADNCGPYRKSLLYLIHFALEPAREEPILGLEVSLRGNGTLKRIFALDGQPSAIGEVIWSESPSSSGRGASRSTSHGGFDDDVPTMDSMLRRVLDVNDTAPIQSFARFRPADSRELDDPWTAPSEREAEILPLLQPFLSVEAAGSFAAPPSIPSELLGLAAPPAAMPAGSGTRRALCVGIDRYPTAPLGGCVADARLWADTLVRLGFERPAMLLDEQATRGAILDALGRLVGEGRPGDVLVFQFAGHGTQVRDLDEDEIKDSKDEAFCPFDFATGALLIDDDVAAVFSRIPDGVNVTCFIDCCHSATNTRLAGGRQKLPSGPSVKARFLVATPALEQAHAAFRQQRGLVGSGARTEEQMREINFAACQADQVALESQGQGEFTRRATRILSAGIEGLTHAAFQQRVEAAFEPGAQRPFLHCADDARNRALLQPLTGGRAAAGGAPGPAVPCANEPVADLLRALAKVVAPGA